MNMSDKESKSMKGPASKEHLRKKGGMLTWQQEQEDEQYSRLIRFQPDLSGIQI